MLIKEADDRTADIAQLESLIQSCQDKSLKTSLTKDLAMLRSGLKGEGSTAYYLEYYFRESKNWMLIHDLRLEHNGRIAGLGVSTLIMIHDITYKGTDPLSCAKETLSTVTAAQSLCPCAKVGASQCLTPALSRTAYPSAALQGKPLLKQNLATKIWSQL